MVAQAKENLIKGAEMRTGELLKAIPKAKENQYTKVAIDTNVEKQKPKPKKEVIKSKVTSVLLLKKTKKKLLKPQELNFLEEKKAKNLLPKAYEIYEARLNRKE